MARPVKCPVCEEYFDRDEEEFVTYSKRHYHKSCFDTYKKDADQYKDLIEYICTLRNETKPTTFVTKQIQRFRSDEFGYTVQGIKLALYYYTEILGKRLIQDKKVGIGIVEYIYDEAQQYFLDLQDVVKHNRSVNNLKQEKRPVQYKARDNKYRDKKIIDLEDVFNDD